ncbi:MAG: S-adenosylmethionine-dependent methyltransferase [bacterium]|nr:MAG: S-adenosylmethionine-dependent methyltransferase [bacterium]
MNVESEFGPGTSDSAPGAGSAIRASSASAASDREVKRYFERHGEPDLLPRLSRGVLQTAIRRAALAALRSAPRPILDVGCGDGQLLELLEGEATEGLLGCDFALPVVRVARHRMAGRAQFASGRLQALPFRPGSVGTVVCINTLYNLPSRGGLAEALAEFARVVCSGGRLVFELRNPLHPLIRALFWWNRTAEHPLWTHGLREARRRLTDCGLALSAVVPILGPCRSLSLANLVIANRP